MAANTWQGGIRGQQIHNGGKVAVITTNETNALATKPGILGRLFITEVGTTATVDIYDDPSTTNNKFVTWVSADGKVDWELNIPFSRGLTVITGGTVGRVVLVYQATT